MAGGWLRLCRALRDVPQPIELMHVGRVRTVIGQAMRPRQPSERLQAIAPGSYRPPRSDDGAARPTAGSGQLTRIHGHHRSASARAQDRARRPPGAPLLGESRGGAAP